MIGWLVFLVLAACGVLALVVVLSVLLVGPMLTGAVEKARLQRETAEASWRIHQRAVESFGQLLEAARSGRQEDAP